jgi:histidyl-tRNA synthetase
MIDITIAIDKLDKTGLDKVKDELAERGLNKDQVLIIEKYLQIKGDPHEITRQAEELLGNTEDGKKGIDELSYLLKLASLKNLQPDLSLARGLNYYTGIIFEVKATKAEMGSIGGGGRYDDLTGLFGVPGIPGVGISFGVDRIYDVMEELKLFPEGVHIGTQVLFFNLGNEESLVAFELMQKLREKGVRAELFHEKMKFDKQFRYAEKKNIPYVVIMGEEEIKTQTCQLKDTRSGKQQTLKYSELLAPYIFV